MTDEQRDFEEERAVEAQARAENEAEAAESEARMAFEGGILGKALITQLRAIGGLSGFARDSYLTVKELAEEGVKPEWQTATITLDALELQAISLGANLVGFFVPEAGESAKSIMLKVSASLAELPELTEEQKAKLEAAEEIIQKRAWAKMMGFDSIEAYETAVEQAQAEENGLVAEPVEPTGVAEPIEQGSWGRGDE